MALKHTKDFKDKIDSFTKDFEKSFGSQVLKVGGKIVPYETISTGSITLDLATGVGGYVIGRLHQVWAPPDLGKTTLSLMACAEAQKKFPDRMVAYIDVENKVDEEWAEAHGVDRDRWYLYKPNNAEDVADSMQRFLTNPQIALVVIDSVGAMIGRVEQEKQADEATVAIVARIVTRMVKIANSFAESNRSVVLIINQVRSNISRYGASTELPGGNALKHSTTMQFKIRGTNKPALTATVKGEKIPVAKEIAVTVERNKCAPAGVTAMILLCSVDSKYGAVGINQADEAAKAGIKTGVIKRSGAWYTLPNDERFNGEVSVIDYLERRPNEVAKIRKAALAAKSEVVYEEELAADDPKIEVDQETGEILAPEPSQKSPEPPKPLAGSLPSPITPEILGAEEFESPYA
jgi:recombination protein RecA